MTAFRARSAQALVLSALTACFAVQPVLLRAQSNPQGPTYNMGGEQASDHPPQKSAVQQALESLYRKDHRPVPEYMNGQTANNQSMNATSSEPSALNDAPEQNQPAANGARPSISSRMMPSRGGQGNVQQQLSDYYGSQGKTMPWAQRGSQNGAAYQQAVSVDESAQRGAAKDSATQKPHLIDRINPFRRFSRSAKKESESRPVESSIARRQPAPVQQPVSPRPAPQALPAPALMAESVTDESRPADNAQPVSAVPHVPVALQPTPAYVSSAIVSARPAEPAAPAAPVATAMPPAPAPSAPNQVASSPVEANIPVDLGANRPLEAKPVEIQPQRIKIRETKTAQIDLTPQPAAGRARLDDVPNPFNEMSESEADRTGDPYTGLLLDDEQHSTSAQPAPKASAQPRAFVAEPSRKRIHGEDSVENSKPAAASPRATVEAHPQAPIVQREVPPRTFSQPKNATHLAKQQHSSSKLQKIAERVGQKGLKGFCPVALRDHRELVDANVALCSIYQGHKYCMSSAEAKEMFDRNPAKYAPMAGGVDIVIKANSDQIVEGVLDHAVWYRDRLYLFSSPESMEAFSLSPESYAAPYVHRQAH